MVYRSTPELRIDWDRRAAGYTLGELAWSQLPAFWRAMWPIARPGERVAWGWHYQHISERAQVFLDRGYGTLAIALPFGTGKSTALNILTPSWDWLHRPNQRWLNISAGRSGGRDSRLSRNVILSPEYQALAARAGVAVGLASDQNEKHDYVTTAGGQRHFYTAGSTVIGVDADRLVADDIVDPESVEGVDPAKVRAELAELKSKYGRTWVDRLRQRYGNDPDIPPGVRFIIGQRVARGDPIDWAIGWRDEDKDPLVEVIVVPEEYDPNVPGGPCEVDPREVGELLNPAFRGRKMIEDLRQKHGERFVSTRLNQRPTNREGGMLREEWYRTPDRHVVNAYPEHPRLKAAGCAEVFATIDTGETENASSDPTVVQVWGRIGTSIFLLHEERRQVGLINARSWLRSLWGLEDKDEHGVTFPPGSQVRRPDHAESWGSLCDFALTEEKGIGRSLLEEHCLPNMVAFRPSDYQRKTAAGRKVTMSKADRAGSFATMSEGRRVYLPLPHLAAFDVHATVDEWVGFGAGAAHDDRVDTASMAALRVNSPKKDVVRRRAVRGLRR